MMKTYTQADIFIITVLYYDTVHNEHPHSVSLCAIPLQIQHREHQVTQKQIRSLKVMIQNESWGLCAYLTLKIK